jgi:hypothetical protein
MLRHVLRVQLLRVQLVRGLLLRVQLVPGLLLRVHLLLLRVQLLLMRHLLVREQLVRGQLLLQGRQLQRQGLLRWGQGLRRWGQGLLLRGQGLLRRGSCSGQCSCRLGCCGRGRCCCGTCCCGGGRGCCGRGPRCQVAGDRRARPWTRNTRQTQHIGCYVTETTSLPWGALITCASSSSALHGETLQQALKPGHVVLDVEASVRVEQPHGIVRLVLLLRGQLGGARCTRIEEAHGLSIGMAGLQGQGLDDVDAADWVRNGQLGSQCLHAV